MNDTLIIILTLGLLVLVLFVLPRWRMSRAISQVVNIFRRHDATSTKSAKTSRELGFKSKGILPGILTRRDYKLDALSSLINAGVIRQVEGDKLYMSEEKLASSQFAASKQ